MLILTRRTTLFGAGVLGTMLAVPHFRIGSAKAREVNKRIEFEIPRDACDAHVHVIGNPTKFPMSPQRDYTPPPATADELIQALKRMRIDRVVIVTPTIYGTDNSATLAAIETLGKARARGVALIDRGTSSRTLEAMTRAGIAGVRLFLNGKDASDIPAATRKLHYFFSIAERNNCNIDISAPPDATAALLNQLKSSPVPLVFDYFGWLEGGVEQRGFDAIISLINSGIAYVKLSEPYRLSRDPPNYGDLVPVVHALVSANPNRVLWGSGWPHVDSSAGRGKLARNLPIDDRHLLNLLGMWVPDPAARHKILVENPAQLYGFAA